MKKTVVDERMQQGYVCYLTEPDGRNFDPSLGPDLTPAEILVLAALGV